MGLCQGAPESGVEPAPKPAPLTTRENTHQLALSPNANDSANKSEKPRTATMIERLQAPVTQHVVESYQVGRARRGKYECVLYPGFNFWSRKVCQDAFVVAQLDGDSKEHQTVYQFFSIFDGHGVHGEKVSHYLVKNLAYAVQAQLQKAKNRKELHKALQDSFMTTQSSLERTDLDLLLSGSTATCVLLGEKELHVAWLGDSRATLGYIDSKTGRIMAQDITTAHNFEDKNERKRCEKVGAKVRQSINEMGQPVGPFRVFQKGKNGPGLAVSRSFGDQAAHDAGVISDPDAQSVDLKPEHQFLIIASDGVWDQISSQEAVECIHQAKRADDAGKKLTLKCAERWIDANQGLSDDISCIIVYLNLDGSISQSSASVAAVPLDRTVPAHSKSKESLDKEKSAKEKAVRDTDKQKGDGENEKERPKLESNPIKAPLQQPSMNNDKNDSMPPSNSETALVNEQKDSADGLSTQSESSHSLPALSNTTFNNNSSVSMGSNNISAIRLSTNNTAAMTTPTNNNNNNNSSIPIQPALVAVSPTANSKNDNTPVAMSASPSSSKLDLNAINSTNNNNNNHNNNNNNNNNTSINNTSISASNSKDNISTTSSTTPTAATRALSPGAKPKNQLAWVNNNTGANTSVGSISANGSTSQSARSASQKKTKKKKGTKKKKKAKKAGTKASARK